MTDIPLSVADSCWPVDTTVCDELTSLDAAKRDVAVALAAQTMRALTGYQVGGCPGTLRPCSVACAAGSPGWHWVNGTFVPVNLSGTWVNVTCGCGWDCKHPAGTSVRLPGVVSYIEEVKVDGVVLAPTAYRVDNGNLLVRTDGQGWPTTQDMGKADTEVGTWSVTYGTGVPVDALGAHVAGMLACEYAKALGGKACSLPKSVTTITRQGITMQITPGAFPEGLTGIPAVDAYIVRWNPYRLKTPPEVWTPDLAGGSVTTWSAP